MKRLRHVPFERETVSAVLVLSAVAGSGYLPAGASSMARLKHVVRNGVACDAATTYALG